MVASTSKSSGSLAADGLKINQASKHGRLQSSSLAEAELLAACRELVVLLCLARPHSTALPIFDYSFNQPCRGSSSLWLTSEYKGMPAS